MKKLQTDANNMQAESAPSMSPGTAPVTPDITPNARWCRRCDCAVLPMRGGKCPICGSFLPGNPSKRRSPVSALRIAALLKEFTDEYQPFGPHGISLCRQRADVAEALERTRVDTPQYQRLIAIQQQLNDALEAARRPAAPVGDPGPPPSLEALLDQVEDIRTKIRKQLRHEAEIEQQRAEGEAAAARRVLEALKPIAEHPEQLESRSDVPPTCSYCQQPITECTTMRTARPDLWSALHHDHPDLIEERRQRATAEMMARIGKPHPWAG